MITIHHCWVFDVDGVITDPVTKLRAESYIIAALADKLSKGEIIAFNSGRSLSWLNEKIVTPLLVSLPAPECARRIFVVGEKGCAWYDDLNGSFVDSFDTSMEVPPDIRQKTKELVVSHFSTSMFFDDSKKVIISVEMHDGGLIKDFSVKQQEFVSHVRALLVQNDLDTGFKIDPTGIATDIEHVTAGKALGITRLLACIKDRGFIVSRFTAVGDSPSDLAMGDALVDRQKSVEFIHVGNKKDIQTSSHHFPIRFSKKLYQKGLLEFLSAKK